MNFPCVNPTDCPSTEDPLANLSSEQLDRQRFYGYRFFRDTSMVCITTTQEEADRCLPPYPTNPPLPVLYTSDEQICTRPCPTGGEETATVVAGSFTALSQAEANAEALAFACQLTDILCAGGSITIFPNTEQTCTVNCQNGTQFSFTIPASSIVGLTQGSANASAYLLACAVAAQLCSGRPPVPEGAAPFGGEGAPPPFPSGPLFGNSPQSCSSTCANGSSFFYTVFAGSFVAESRAIVDAIALSYACQKASQLQSCMSDLNTGPCLSTFYTSQAEVNFDNAVWQLASGSLPPGLAMSNGVVAGTPVLSGAYTFTLQASAPNGSYVQREYTLTVRGITTNSLPNAPTGVAYSQFLASEQFTFSPAWSVTDGVLPDGLTLNSNTGEIAGTPTTAGDYTFTVTASDGTDSCSKQLSISVTGSSVTNIAYWTLDSANPLLNIDQVSGDAVQIQTAFGTSTPSAVPAVISNGVRWSTSSMFGNCQGIVFQESNNIACQGNGISFAFWINTRSAVLGFVGANTSLFSYYPNIGDLSQKLEWTGDNAAANGDINLNASTFPFALPPQDGFHFCVVTVDALGNVSASIDGAALTPLGNGGALIAQPAATAQFSINVGSILTSGTGAFYTLDEVALFEGALSDAQVAYLYNGGAGRTYPLSLP